MTEKERIAFLKSLSPEQYDAVRAVVIGVLDDALERVKSDINLSRTLASAEVSLGTPT